MPPKKTPAQKPLESYEHSDKQRLNNPPAGLVTPATDPDQGAKRTYAYDPHLDPQLVWAGKAEHTSFEVPTVSLHVHERIEPRTILQSVQRPPADPAGNPVQPSLFARPAENPPLREAIEFYQHGRGWSNRLVAGDSLLVMNSLLEKEGQGGKVQMVYFDPPYGIKYGSNFQPFVNKRDVKDGKDDDLTAEPEQIRAFRDTWELGIHSYLTYLRDRLLLARELLTESGSIFVQISDENLHHTRELLDEVFGAENFISMISFKKIAYQDTTYLANVFDYLLWYGKSRKNTKVRKLFRFRKEEALRKGFDLIEMADGTVEKIPSNQPLPQNAQLLRADNLTSQGATEKGSLSYVFDGIEYHPRVGNHWKTHLDGLNNLDKANRLIAYGKTLCYKRYASDFPVLPFVNVWDDTVQSTFSTENIYVVQTYSKVIERCMLMTTDPGDLVFDPTCGSGSTAFVAEQWGRRWITCDTSRVALTLAKQRLMTALFDYYQLAHPHQGVGSGFLYKTVPHITLKSIANNPDIREGMSQAEIETAIARYAPQETLYDQPLVDRQRKRICGPFTVEAVPAPAVKSIDELLAGEKPASDASIARSGETLRQGEWRDELLRTGIRGKAGQFIRFARLETLPGSRWLHADGQTRPSDEGANHIRETAGTAYQSQRIVISFGPEHAPLNANHVARAIEEAHTLVPRPQLIVFAAFQFDPEAARDIDEMNWPGLTLLKAQMNADLLTDDLKKKRASNQSFWLIGQPDVALEPAAQAGLWQVRVAGFDYYNTKTGSIESGSARQIAVWLLDTDYDGRSVYPRQVFFPMSASTEGWARLAKNLRAEIDEDLIEAYSGTVSLPFALGTHKRVAVKIVDDRGIESLKVVEVQP